MPMREEIISACMRQGYSKILKYEVKGGEPLFVKYGFDLMGEAETQKYLYQQSLQDPKAPRIPEVYDSFEGSPRVLKGEYIVMEFIEAPTVKYWLDKKPEMAELLHDKVADAVRWLLNCPLPAEPRIGPVGRGPAQHRAFADGIAPLEFDSIDAVQRYFNKAITKFRPKGAGVPKTVDFSNEPICFYHSDFRPSNFHYDPESQKITMVDFQHVGMGPKSFASFPFHLRHDDFHGAIATRIGYPQTESIWGMARASSYLQMCSNPTLGLDNSGHQRPNPLAHRKKIDAAK